MKRCPACAEEVQDAAIKCRHCGTSMPTDETVARRGRIVWMLVVGAVLIAIGGGVVYTIEKGLRDKERNRQEMERDVEKSRGLTEDVKRTR